MHGETMKFGVTYFCKLDCVVLLQNWIFILRWKKKADMCSIISAVLMPTNLTCIYLFLFIFIFLICLKLL